MPWKLNSDRPIFVQIIEKLQTEIISGNYKPGAKVPAVRELAQDAGVNPNTMQRALMDLERMGLVYTERTSGRFVTEDTNLIEELKKTQAENIFKEFISRMKQIGYKENEILALVKDEMERSNV